MVSPIAVATQGLINSPLAVASVRGRLTIFTVITKPKGGGGQKGGLQHPKYYTATPKTIDKLLEQIKQEDEEIIAIVMAIAEVLNK